MTTISERAEKLQFLQVNLEDMNVRPYDGFNVMDVGYNGGNRADATDFLMDGYKNANDPTSYAAILLHDQKENAIAMRRVIAGNMQQASIENIFENIMSEGATIAARLASSSKSGRETSSLRTARLQENTKTAVEKAPEHVEAKAKNSNATKPAESGILTNAYNAGAQLVSDVGDGLASRGKNVQHNLAVAAEAVDPELRKAGRSALNGNFSDAATHAGNAVSNTLHKAATTLSDGVASVKSTIVNAPSNIVSGVSSTVTSTLSGWGSSLTRSIGLN